jgi:type II secretory pathway predicted ATPase ExeA
MSYAKQFGLEREPFSNAPDARFYFNSDQHKHALVKLMYSVDSNKGLAVVIGGVGTGKTTLARRLLDNLPEDKYESSLLVMVHSGITPEWILTRIAMQLGVKNPDVDRLVLLKQLYERLRQIDEEGRRAVVLIDEAQMLQTRELMEEFRGLLNLEIPGKKLLNIIFFGLPEVEDCLALDEPLAQRVAVKCRLQSLSVEIAVSYIKHRLQVAGSKRMLFSAESIPAIHAYAGGVPRLINTIADNCLFEAFLRKVETVNSEVVHSVAGDLGLLSRPSPSPIPTPKSRVALPSKEPGELDDIESMLDRLEQKL